ncbi:uncharacterized protein C8Q71DRAFT_431702 [Rhodofomes roseus]|uniref:Uncharacterized protein n=1 Tax=Rhodofomes roseus TaxID=34475 RepID=A0ABQ8KQM9_9APHY|nr:uncharacterized protein C8Q71DRAFT_431702 [Rhodofomes roseus]KAH9840937.1 hypothetical protein C8Q71DRAFT_431702 [Rhodofomes roseus]
MAELSLIGVNLATACIGSMAYGVFFVLFVLSTYLMLQYQHKPPGNGTVRRSPLLTAGFVLFLGVTGQWICVVLRTFDAFLNYDGGKDPVYFYADLRQPTEAAKLGCWVTVMIVSDAMIIYRMYIIWNRNLRVLAFPLLTLTAVLVSGIGVVYHFAVYPVGENVYASTTGRWIVSDCLCSLCTNLYCTSKFLIFLSTPVRTSGHMTPLHSNDLIPHSTLSGKGATLWRKWSDSRSFSCASSHRSDIYYDPQKALVIVVESAGIYTAWNIFFVAVYLAKSNLNFTAVDVWCPVAGIANMLINVRVGMGWAGNDYPSRPGMAPVEPRLPAKQSPAHPVEINVARVVESDDYGMELLQQKQHDGVFVDDAL